MRRSEPLSRQRLTANAYRVLGVSAGASQAEVEAAARKMRIWPAPSDIPPTQWDLPWLGALTRGKNEIEQALSALNEPQTRIEQRLFWFAAAGSAGGHDPALKEVAGLMVGDENFMRVDRWGKALADLRRAAGDADYQQWFLNVEKDGDFEKRAQDAEIIAALAGMQDSIADSVAARMRQFIDSGDLDGCVRLVNLLPAAGVEAATTRRIQFDLCNRMEDLLVARCGQIHGELAAGLKKPTKGRLRRKWAAKKLCTQVEAQITQSVDPLVSAVSILDGPSGERMRRIGIPAAQMMRNLWIGWNRAGKPHSAKNAMRKARHLARGTLLEKQLLEEARPRPLSKRQKWRRAAAAILWAGLIALAALSHSTSTTTPPPPVWMPSQHFAPLPPANTPSLDLNAPFTNRQPIPVTPDDPIFTKDRDSKTSDPMFGQPPLFNVTPDNVSGKR